MAARAKPSLVEIQRLQFSDRAQAEAALFAFLAPDISGLERVVVNTKAESLNSINGFLTIEGREHFFKTHTEEHETEGSSADARELYNTELLRAAGYPVILPGLVRTLPGKQIAIYEKIEFPTLFDVAKKEEDLLLRGAAPSPVASALIDAQRRLDAKIFEIYGRTLALPARPTKGAPIHQLFSERLREGRRVDDFYRGKAVHLPGAEVPFERISTLEWTINGVSYRETIADLIALARRVLDAGRPTATVCGHGDAHNGNVWVEDGGKHLWYFDAAFAGHHDPLLDVVKPLFHNALARWMYFPDEAVRELDIDYAISGTRIEVRHSFRPSELRRAFFDSKVDEVLVPTVERLANEGALPADWKDALRAALFCCPFLTVNLAAAPNRAGKLDERYDPAIRLLGLSMAVEIGALPRRDGAGASEIRKYTARLADVAAPRSSATR
jgi:hypothetical protein